MLATPPTMTLRCFSSPATKHYEFPASAPASPASSPTLRPPPGRHHVASGSEVALAVDAYEELSAEGVSARVVSLPSWALIEEQDQTYRDLGLPPEITVM